MTQVTNVPIPNTPTLDGDANDPAEYMRMMKEMQEWAMKFQLTVNTLQTRFAAVQDANKSISYGGR